MWNMNWDVSDCICMCCPCRIGDYCPVYGEYADGCGVFSFKICDVHWDIVHGWLVRMFEDDGTDD